MRLWLAAMGVCALAGCSAEPVTNAPADAAPADANALASAAEPAAANMATQAAPATASDGALRDWLEGAWAYGEECATDFSVRFHSDGTLDNSGDIGRWAIDGDTVTETITARFEMGEEGEQKVDPPQVRRYKVERIDQGHGRILIEGRIVPILRC